MNNFKYNLQKNKYKILLVVTIIVLVAVIFGFYKYFKKHDVKHKPDITYKDKDIRKADYIICGDDKGNIDLTSVSKLKNVDTMSLKKDCLYARNNNLDNAMVYDNDSFYLLSNKKDKLQKDKVFTLGQQIKSFKFNDKYIVANTTDKLIMINIANKKSNEIQVKNVDKYNVIDSYLVYTVGNKMTSVDLNGQNTKTIDLGDKTSDIYDFNKSAIIFNHFGNGLDKSLILKVNPKDLYIQNVITHDSKDVMAIDIENNEKFVSYTDKIKNKGSYTFSHYKLDVNKDKGSKVRTELNLNGTASNVITSDNTVSAEGYVYSALDKGTIAIYDLRAEATNEVIQSNKSFFMPILK